jgi:5-methylcytosine-specific restriction protein A
MGLLEVLTKISSEYAVASNDKFAQHPLARFIRSEAPRTIEEALGPLSNGLRVVGSAGAGNWASVPWISVFDPIVTESATRGYYVVYLFHASEPIIHLSLNQGTTAVREEFGSDARLIMRDQATLMRHRVEDLFERDMVTQIELGSSQELPRDYEAAHATGYSYKLTDPPTESRLISDLRKLTKLYLTLTFRGGLDPSLEPSSDQPSSSATVEETRKYGFHRKIERNTKATKLAKDLHGTTCQACGFDFTKTYGVELLP